MAIVSFPEASVLNSPLAQVAPDAEAEAEPDASFSGCGAQPTATAASRAAVAAEAARYGERGFREAGRMAGD
ncbi:hypothetical protein SGFS_086800 [Streptomyces graminofaciens]|uniref:Uncharacterized protein n=1 Tax=Streptomyces graminofaciens TaxID=68212 RepID=A0ABN5VVZ2_9ACTN|nr:hypothetical protein SGFS_086800 [Streptomyces graminofaciens]